jgi:hypothetical protein
LLELLEFKPATANFTDEQPGYFYDFGNLRLEVVQVTSQYLRPIMLFTGTMRTARSFGSVEFELLMEVDSFEQGVALITMGIGYDFMPLKATPWFDQGKELQDHLPGRAERREYEGRPQCMVEADWFRLAAKKLRAAAESSVATDTFSVSFKQDTLRFELPDRVVVVPAAGDQWSTTYRGLVTELRYLSRRTPSGGLSVSVWKERIQIGRLGLSVSTVGSH